MSRRSSGIGVLAAAVCMCLYLMAGIGLALAGQKVQSEQTPAFTDAFLAESARNAASHASAEREVNNARANSATRHMEASVGQVAQGAAMPTMMPTVAPLFLQDAHFKSTLVLVNAASLSTYADVTLTALNGAQIVEQRVQFAPHSQQQLDIGALLASAASVAGAGSVSVMQSPDLEGMSILAQLSITNQGQPGSEPNYIDEELQMPSTSGSSVLRGVAERSEGSPLVAITSLSASSQTVTIQCLEERGASSSKSVALLAGETLLTQACNAGTAYGNDFATAMEGNDSRMRNSVGISLTSTAMPGEFAAFGIAPHGGANNRYFSEVSFTDPKMLVSPNTTFTGVPMGTSPLLPDGKYVPELALANFSSRAIHVHVKYATTSGTSPSTLDAGSVTLPANATRWLRLDDLHAVDSLQNSFMIDSDGAPGDVMAKLVSASNSQLHEVELPGKDEKNVNNGGAHPWTIDDGNQSTLLLFNHGTAPDTFNVAISTEGMTWQKAYQLAPMQTLAISIGQLIQSQAKDDKGSSLPSGAVQGMVNWFPPDAGNSSGRMLVSNKAMAMARSFSCDLGDFLCHAIVTGYTIYLNPGDTVLFADVVGEICSGIPCTGTEVGQGSGFTYSWSANAPSILSISGSSTSSTVHAYGGSFGIGAITATISGTYEVNGREYNCTETGGADGNVFGITSISPNTFVVGTSGSVQIDGGGLSGKGTPSVVFNGGGITVSSATVVSDSEITATYSISCSAPTQNVYVTFPGFDNATTNQLPVFVTLPSAPPPTISLAGTNVTGTTQSVVVGQQIALSANNPSLPPCMSFVSGSWSSPPAGTAIGGYSDSNGTGPHSATDGGAVQNLPPNNATGYTFYWTAAGNSIQMNYAYEMSGGGGYVDSPYASVEFNVAGIGSPSVAVSSYPSMSINNLTGCSSEPGGPFLVYGNVSGPAPGCSGSTTGSAGILLTNNSTGIPSSGGTFSFIQVISTDNQSFNSGAENCTVTAGIDQADPYAGMNGPNQATDAPELPLPYTADSRTFNATMYLWWTPNPASGCSGWQCTIPVPIGYENWGFSGSATQSNGTWTATTNGTPGGSGSFTYSNTNFPQWSGLATETCNP